MRSGNPAAAFALVLVLLGSHLLPAADTPEKRPALPTSAPVADRKPTFATSDRNLNGSSRLMHEKDHAEVALAAVLAAKQPLLLAKRGGLLFEDYFSREELGPKWKIGMGTFNIGSGVLSGAENPADHHGGFVKTRFDFKDVIAEFSFKFRGSTSFNFTMDDSAHKASHAGHICRVSIYPTQVYLGDMKFGPMKNEVYEKLHDPKTTADEKKEVQASIKDKSATFKLPIAPEVWHQARVEVVGDEMLVSIDGKPTGYLKSEGIAHPSKNLLGFTILGQWTYLDNIRVYDAAVSAGWGAKRADVLAGMGK